MAVDPFWNMARKQERATRRTPPYPVILVALFQFLKAGLAIFVACALTGFGAGFKASDVTLFGLSIGCIVIAVLGGIAIYFIRSGILLLRLEKTARRRLMWNIAAGWLIYGTSFSGLLFGESPFIASWPNRILICVLLLDTFVYCCLALYPDVARSFGEENQTDILP